MRPAPAFPCWYDYAESEKARYDPRTSSRARRPGVAVTVFGAAAQRCRASSRGPRHETAWTGLSDALFAARVRGAKVLPRRSR